MSKDRVVIVGSGNVAEALARNIARCDGLALRQIYARNAQRGRYLAELAGCEWCGVGESLADADIYIIAVTDRAVEELSHSLRFPAGALVVHTAGSVPLSALPATGIERGILYLFQSFTAGRDIALDDVPIFIEAESDDVRERLMHVASQLSRRVEYATSERRRVIHLTGVLVNNFVNALYTAGADILAAEGLDFDILKPLVRETAAKALGVSDPRDVQTGPAVRGDMAVAERHKAMLADSPILRRVYNDLTDYIWETSKRM